MPSLAPPKAAELKDELARYLSTDPEQVLDVLLWWTEHKATYPNLSRMALDYLSIPGMYPFTSEIDRHADTCFATATSTDVERVFSQGRLLLSHIRNHLLSQSIRALMCLGSWSQLGLVKDADIYAVTALAEVEGEEEDLADSWDVITTL